MFVWSKTAFIFLTWLFNAWCYLLNLVDGIMQLIWFLRNLISFKKKNSWIQVSFGAQWDSNYNLRFFVITFLLPQKCVCYFFRMNFFGSNSYKWLFHLFSFEEENQYWRFALFGRIFGIGSNCHHYVDEPRHAISKGNLLFAIISWWSSQAILPIFGS